MHRWPRTLAVAVVTVFVASVNAWAFTVPQGNPQTGDPGVAPVGSTVLTGFLATVVEVGGACLGTFAVGTLIWKAFKLMAASDSHTHADAMRGLWIWVVGALVGFGATLLVGIIRGLEPAGA